MRHALLALALTAVLLAPAAASASEVSMPSRSPATNNNPYTLVFRGGPDANRATIAPDGPFPSTRGIVVADAGSPLAAVENCRPDPRGVFCDLLGRGLERIDVQLEGGGDEVDVTMGAGSTSIDGGAGDDRLFGLRGLFAGGPGGDLMEARVEGELSYAERTAGVRVSFDGIANDGEDGEGDDVRGRFDKIVGGPGADRLSAPEPSLERPALHGLAGDDTLIGGAGIERLYGGEGADSLAGGPGDDVLWGADGADLVRGGDGEDTATYVKPDDASGTQVQAGVSVTLNDQPDDGAPGEGDDVGSDVENIIGGPGPDRLEGNARANLVDGWWGDDVLLGGGGDDELLPASGADRVVGGAGRDRVIAGLGLGDRVELRDGEPDYGDCPGLRPLDLDADPFDALVGCFSYAYFSPARYLVVRAVRTKSPSLTLGCRFTGGPERCRGKVRMHRRGTRKLLGTGSYDFAPRTRARVRVKLTAEGRRLRALAKRPVPFVAYAVPARMTDPTPVLGRVWPEVRGDWVPTGPRRAVRR